MKKVLLVTIFKVPNFGSVLQAYATQQILEQNGCECHVLNYDHLYSEHSRQHGIKPKSWKSKLAYQLGLFPYHRKEKKLSKFVDQHLNVTTHYDSLAEIARAEGRGYDYYIVGSDQVWNSRFTFCDPVFLLNFIDTSETSNKCISIASSFACKKLDEKYEQKYKDGIEKFKSLSVREINGIKILNKLGRTDGKLLLDPTLLLSKDQWGQLSTNRCLGKRYILLYMLTYAFEPRPYIYDVLKVYQNKMKCKIIVLEGYREFENTDLEFEDATDSSISDFVDYFMHASLVVTTSFHGTAFALNFGVPLISVVPNGGDDRQCALLEQLNLKCCTLRVNDDINRVNPFYDANAEQNKLQEIREDGLQWINNQF